MEPIVEPLAAWKTVLPAVPALALLVFGLVRLRRELVPSRWLPLVLGGALAVRVLWMPIGRHVYDGHEAEYLDLWMGTRELTQGGTMLYPAMQWLYRGLGIVWPHETGPLVLALLASLVSVAAAQGVVGRLAGERVGWVAAGLMGLWGTHAFWSSSAYNVMIPHALAWTALWGLALLIDRKDALGAACIAGGAAALAVACRVEAVLVAPLGLAWLVLYRPPEWRRWLGPLVVGAALGMAAAALVLVPGGGDAPGTGQQALAFASNWDLLAYLAPLDRPWVWPALLVGAAVGLRHRPRLVAPLLLFLPLSHLVFSTFDDAGFRHQLNALAAASCLLACAALDRRAIFVLPLGVVGLLLHSQDVADRYYASEETYGETLDPSLPVWSLQDLGGCALINEDSRVVPEAHQRSHFNLLDPGEVDTLRQEHGCIHWLQTVEDYRWSSRGVRARTLRTQHLYRLEPVAVVRSPGGFVGLLVEVGDRR